MLFITNRIPKQSIRTRRGRSFDFDLRDNAAGNSVFFCERNGPGDYTEIGSADLLARLKDSQYRQLLVFVHGFNNLPEQAFACAEELQRLCDKKMDKEALVLPLIWPCDDDRGVVQDYWDDQKAADASAFAFARVLQKFLAWRNDNDSNPASDPCLKRINLLAHSMGNRVLRETLAVWHKYDLPEGVPMLFRNTFMAAADVVNETLYRGERGELITHSARNVVVYFASDDLALRASKAANLKSRVSSRRLGHTGPEDMRRTPTNVYAVDCDDVNTLYDSPVGHSYFRSGGGAGKPGLVFDHIFDAMLTGRVYVEDSEHRMTVIRAH